MSHQFDFSGSSIRITAGSRLHMTLLDLGYATDRAYGGCGLAIDEPKTIIDGHGSDRLRLLGFRRSDHGAVLAAARRLEGMLGISVTGDLRLVTAPSAHTGFGSRTAVVLSSLALACRLSGTDVDDPTLCLASGRGGTSSIGMSAFVGRGGLLLDPGRAHEGRRVFAPSSRSFHFGAPVFASSVPFPPSWKVLLFLPCGRRFSGVAEVAFFTRNTPLPSLEVRNVAAAIQSFKSGVIMQDIDEAAHAVHRISSTGFKRLEIENQPAAVGAAVQRLAELSRLPVGMSSVGPLVYAIFRTGTEDLEKLRHIASEAAIPCLGLTSVSRDR